MNLRTRAKIGGLRQRPSWLGRFCVALILVVIAFALHAPAFVPEALALTSNITLEVREYGSGTPIEGFTYLVNEDNTGDPSDNPADCDPVTNPLYPAGCDWPSIKPMASHSPVRASGTVTNTIPGSDTFLLADGRYLISVRADGYKLGGKHVRLPDDAGTVVVELVKDPLPLSKIRVHVFHDNRGVNGEDDLPLEAGIDGTVYPFNVVVEDTTGEVTVDWYGNPICAEYDGTGSSTPLGDPIPGTGGNCIIDANGDVVIENLPRGKYEVLAIPPDGSDWIQTTTIEGTHVIDAWIEEGNDGYAPREGFQVPLVWVGFVRPCTFGDLTDDCDSDTANDTGTGIITGTVKTMVEWTPPVNPLVLGDPVDRPYVALTNIGGNDEQVYLGRGNPDGTFQINNVPDGVYQMAIWDYPLDYIISFRTVIIPQTGPCSDGPEDRTVDMNFVSLDGVTCTDQGGVPIPRWFGWISGYVFMDDGLDGSGVPIPGLDPFGDPRAGNGIRDCANPADPTTCERGILLYDLDTRFRDGSIQYGTLTDGSGYYEFPEVFELEKFAILEVGFGRFARTGQSLHDEYDPSIVTPLPGDMGGDLLLNALTWAAKRSIVDWGKANYNPGENGGISGIVQYATTRNEFEARLQATEDYEPGIPNVTVRLYSLGPDDLPNTADDVLLNEVATDAWEHPSAANGNGCDALDSNGVALPDPLGLGPNCIEVPNISNEVKDGAFDGGYAFESYWDPHFGVQGAIEIDGLPPGDYVVEVVPPLGYQVVKEEDLNVTEGNDLVPAIPPPPCVGDLHLVNVTPEFMDDYPAFPFNGQDMPLCDKKLVTLQEGQNAAADFYLFTTTGPGSSWSSDESVPIPGRIFGFLLDDLNVETNPDFIYYGEKRGIPNAPVGIRDFTGRLITTVRSDENGIFEVLLPSTYVADCPIPGGVCPQIYLVVGNDPGDPGNPNPDFNPNYHTWAFWFDVWPGKTTFADVALFPITSFHRVDIPGSQFQQPALCLAPATTPYLERVSAVYGSNAAAIPITIYGSQFGTTTGSVTLGGASITVNTWTDTQINATIPAVHPGGPQQLQVIGANGETTAHGLTFHVLESGSYDPPVIEVGPTKAITTVQAGINAATVPGTIVAVDPGTYFETVIFHQNVKLQGHGPGAQSTGDGGTIIDGRFSPALRAAWDALLLSISFDGAPGVKDGAALTVVGLDGEYTADPSPQIDGFRFTGARGGSVLTGGGAAIHFHAYGRNMEISNNVFQGNSGSFGGAITLGRAHHGDLENDNIRIRNNRILNNGGVSRAGAIGIFNGADNYEIDHNELCGNYSGEYGGGISHFGLSPGGSIHHNRMYFNGAFDEGGGILVGGEQGACLDLIVDGTCGVDPEDPGEPSPVTLGSGDVDIYNNLVQANLSNDDGGGIRALAPLTYTISISNNIIINNVSTDFGGGIALDDSSDVEIVNNTIARNVNTSTAEDSDLLPHAAGMAVELYSDAFADLLGLAHGTGYPDPVMFNNIICENEAYTWDGVNLNFDSYFDLEVFAGNHTTQLLHPTYSLLTDPSDGIPLPGQEDFAEHVTNLACGDLDLLFTDPYTTTLDAVAFRMEPNFVDVRVVTVDLPPELLGDYHIQGAPAKDAGTGVDPLGSGVSAPPDDFDDETRDASPDIGADEVPGVVLTQGWNAISLAANAAQNDLGTLAAGVPVAEALASIQGSYNKVFAYDGCTDQWLVYDPTAPASVNTLDTIYPYMGLWIEMNTTDTLTYSVTTPATTDIPLCTGWNFVGYPALVSKPMDQVLAPIAGVLTRVYAYDASNGGWKVYDPVLLGDLSTLTQFDPGLGYWIKVTGDTMLTINSN